MSSFFIWWWLIAYFQIPIIPNSKIPIWFCWVKCVVLNFQELLSVPVVSCFIKSENFWSITSVIENPSNSSILRLALLAVHEENRLFAFCSAYSHSHIHACIINFLINLNGSSSLRLIEWIKYRVKCLGK